MANKHICCLKPGAVVLVKFKWDIAVTLSVWDHWCNWAVGNTHCSIIRLANLYAWRGAMLWGMYCVVQGQGRTKNTFHELLKEQTCKGKMLQIGPVGCRPFSFHASSRQSSIHNVHLKHTRGPKRKRVYVTHMASGVYKMDRFSGSYRLKVLPL